uniref:SMC hinge domain-containing protein n=1 Tax=Strongyloides stercoralis TaxID=6248 RepID=A0A0K0EMH8_STRER
MAYISKLTLKNFLSFKEESEFIFDSKVNIICGRNGSGKSNVYTAFLHVFTDLYDKQSTVERTNTLFNSGKYGNEASITIEVLSKVREHDNNNMYLFKKIITPYKQELYFNGNIISRKDLVLQLEALGFQCINKYIVLRQGEIITSKDFNKNGLFKILLQFFDINESVVWEGKCKSAVISCKEKVSNIRISVDSKQQLYSNYSDKVKDYRGLSRLETLKKAFEKKIGIEKFDDYAADIARIKSMIKEYECKHERYSEEKNVISKNSSIVTQQVSECYSKLKDVLEKIDLNKKELFQKSEELEKTRSAFNDAKIDLNEVLAKKSKIRDQISQVADDLVTARNTYAVLQEEIGEVDVTEKDELSSKILSISNELAEKKEILAIMENNSSKKKIEMVESDIQKFSGFLEQEKSKVNLLYDKNIQMKKDIYDLETRIEHAKLEVSKYDEASNETKANLDKELSEKSELILAIEENKKALLDGISIQSPVEEYYSRQRLYGLKAIEEHFNYKNLFDVKNPNYDQYSDIYYGVLCDIFNCNDELAKKCVQLVVPKSTLLGVVVGSVSETKTIKEILDKIECKEKINLYPLESYENVSIRRIDRPNVKPLIDVLTYDEKFRNLIIDIFGSWYIVDDIRVAHEVSRSFNVNCITRDFSVYKRNGQITCGVSKVPPNAIDVRQKFLEDQTKYARKLIDVKKLQISLTIQNLKLNEKNEEINLLQSKLESIEYDRSTWNGDLLMNEARLSDLKNSIIYVEKEMKNSTDHIDGLTSKIEKLNELKNTKMDVQAKDKLSVEVANLEESLKDLNKRMNNLIKRNNNLLKLPEQEKEIKFLEKQHETFTKMLEEDFGDGRLIELNNQLQQRIKDYENVIKELKETDENLSNIESELEFKYKELNDEKENLSSNLKNIYKDIFNILKQIKDLQNQLDKYRGFSEQLSQYQLTVVEEQLFNEYKDYNIKDLKEEYEKIKVRYETVSAIENDDIEDMENYINDFNFIVEKSTSTSNKVEETSNYVDILISGKDRTFIEGSKFIFKQASILFKEFFPAGDVRFQFATKGSVSVDQLTLKDIQGVKVRVKTSSDGNFIECGFSGGQRNVIVLCLIIACHNYFSCPFICFDEIEADFDTIFRNSFVGIIKHLTYNNQVFLTTFREEITKVGGTFYQISPTENGSIVSRISKDEALALIER